MSFERGTIAAEPTLRPIRTGLFGVLVLISILGLVILLGWRDGGRSTE
ncbi:MAG: hypothetical protein M3153_08285 [Chloroflexota bacterium]|nr:hypothetical protein [Chloroflexota bacterium]